MGALEAVILTIITASTPLLLAAIGELVTERSGVLNLGVEGMMIMGAVSGFAAAYTTHSALLGVGAGLLAGVGMSLLFAFLTQTLMTSQVATGLSLTLLGLGLSGMIGEGFTGLPGIKLEALNIPFLSDIPFIGLVIFGHDILVYGSLFIVAGRHRQIDTLSEILPMFRHMLFWAGHFHNIDIHNEHRVCLLMPIATRPVVRR